MASYDRTKRKRLRRRGRERGAWVFIPAAELDRTGIDEPATYRVCGTRRDTVIVRVYRD